MIRDLVVAYFFGVTILAVALAVEVIATRRDARRDPARPQDSASDGRPGPEPRTAPGRAVDPDECNPHGIVRPVQR